MRGVERWSTTEIWRAFFLTRLQSKVDCLREEASKLHLEEQTLLDRAESCQSWLPH